MVCSTLSRRAIRSQVQEETPNPASPEDWRGLGPEEALGGGVSSARDYLRSGSGVVVALWIAVLAMPLLATGLCSTPAAAERGWVGRFSQVELPLIPAILAARHGLALWVLGAVMHW